MFIDTKPGINEILIAGIPIAFADEVVKFLF